MSDGARSLQDARDAFKSISDPQDYDQWADTYNTDLSMMEYKGQVSTVEALMKHLRLNPDQVRVLDVACGTGLVAQKLSPLGFRQFVGVDGCQAMLDKAGLTGLYQDLHLALLGSQPLPANSGEFDVVTMVGALHRTYVPVEVVRELCQAAKPGGLVVMTRGDFQTLSDPSYIEELHRELGRMEEEGLWKLLEMQQMEHYMSDYNRPGSWISGVVYVYQKTL